MNKSDKAGASLGVSLAPPPLTICWSIRDNAAWFAWLGAVLPADGMLEAGTPGNRWVWLLGLITGCPSWGPNPKNGFNPGFLNVWLDGLKLAPKGLTLVVAGTLAIEEIDVVNYSYSMLVV